MLFQRGWRETEKLSLLRVEKPRACTRRSTKDNNESCASLSDASRLRLLGTEEARISLDSEAALSSDSREAPPCKFSRVGSIHPLFPCIVQWRKALIPPQKREELQGGKPNLYSKQRGQLERPREAPPPLSTALTRSARTQRGNYLGLEPL